MIPVSTVPAVKSYLLSQITAGTTADPGHDLLVVLDDPGVVLVDDIIAIGRVETRKVEPWQLVGTGQAGALMERYRMLVTVSVFRGGGDQVAPFQRAWTLASAVETIVRNDPTCGGAVIQAWPVDARDESSWESNHKGRLVTVEIVVDVSAGL